MIIQADAWTSSTGDLLLKIYVNDDEVTVLHICTALRCGCSNMWHTYMV